MPLYRRSREGGNPATFSESHWVPAFARTTALCCFQPELDAAHISINRTPGTAEKTRPIQKALRFPV